MNFMRTRVSRNENKRGKWEENKVRNTHSEWKWKKSWFYEIQRAWHSAFFFWFIIFENFLNIFLILIGFIFFGSRQVMDVMSSWGTLFVVEFEDLEIDIFFIYNSKITLYFLTFISIHLSVLCKHQISNFINIWAFFYFLFSFLFMFHYFSISVQTPCLLSP